MSDQKPQADHSIDTNKMVSAMSAEQPQVDPRYRPDSLFIQHIEQDELGDCTELGEDTTHCRDRINETDTEYIRADLVESLRARVRELEGALKLIHEDAGHITRRSMGDVLMLANRILDTVEARKPK